MHPPMVNGNLKPGQKANPILLDLRNNELPYKSPVTKSCSSVNHNFNSSFFWNCHSISTQSMTNTDSRGIEKKYVPMQNPVYSSPVPSGTNNPAPKKSTGNVNYVPLDFQLLSQSPHYKPSKSSLTSNESTIYQSGLKKRSRP
ncbi:GRB2-associated-binding protein 2 [Cricetulus griseus]|uniref:GRB2-associated-binding protein 2 n=1 Tax=Cricetulus griseus TaxID=10029 RepID=G3INN5_CRIGR|nr:GRB2-associated-binding protein 2 [Cricetulus griseus]